MTAQLTPSHVRNSERFRKHLPWLLAIFALAVLLRSLWVSYLNLGAGNDGWLYWLAANSLADGEGFRSAFTGDYTTSLTPGYSLLLAPFLVLFGNDIIVAKAVNIVAGSLSAVLVYAIATNLRDKRTGIVAGLIFAVFPSQVFFTTTLMAETLFVMLASAFVLLLVLWQSGERPALGWQTFAAGLLLGAMSLVRAESVLMAPALVLLWWLGGVRWRSLGYNLVLLGFGMAVVISPWTVRNYVRVDEFVLIRSQSSNGALAPVRTGLSPDYKEVVRFRSGVESPTFGESFDYYASRPWRVADQGWRKLSDFYGNDDHFTYFSEVVYFSTSGPRHPLSAAEEDRWGLLSNLFYYAVAGVALFGAPLWFARRDGGRGGGLRVLLWFIGCWSLIFLVAVPLTRYHFAIIPAITVLSATALVGLWDIYRARDATSPGIARSRSADVV